MDRHVCVRINYDIPEYIYIEHPQTRKLLKVERALTARLTAPSEKISTVNHARRAHINGALGEIGNVTKLFTSWVVRDALHTPSDIEKGAQIAADAVEHKEKQTATVREQKSLERLGGILNTTVPARPRNQARTREALELKQEALAEIAALEKINQEDKPQ